MNMLMNIYRKFSLMKLKIVKVLRNRSLFVLISGDCPVGVSTVKGRLFAYLMYEYVVDSLLRRREASKCERQICH